VNPLGVAIDSEEEAEVELAGANLEFHVYYIGRTPI